MAAIYLVRHGQASFGKADYDRLSSHGEQQAQRLGQHWQSLPRPDQCYGGDLLRHAQTAEHFAKGIGGQSPSIIVHRGFNEFNHMEVLARYNPMWTDGAAIVDYIETKGLDNREFQREFTRAMDRWISGDFDSEYQESWLGFKARCVRALNDTIEQALAESATIEQQATERKASTKNIIVFTSGGAIASIIQHLWGLTDEHALKVNQQMVNSSVTKILFSDQRVSVDYINNYRHLELEQGDWITYR